MDAIKEQEKIIKRLNLGFIEKNETVIFMLSIISHFLENPTIINNTKLNNIIIEISKKL